MRYDRLLTPLSDAEPCGPDLDELGDDSYLNYILGAPNRMPERYLDFKTGVGIPFDRSTIDLKSEVKAIGDLLDQSRDLRLLVLEARFQALSGQIEGFSDCVQASAALLDTFWDDVHPKGTDGDFTLRQNTVSGLEDRSTIVAALEYAPLLRDQRIGFITLRDHALAAGTAQPREDEPVRDLGTLVDAMRAESNRGATSAMHATVLACQAAVNTMQTRFDESTGYRYSPDFDLLRGVLDQLRAFIELGRPDLNTRTVNATDEAIFDPGSQAASPAGDGPRAGVTPTVAAAATANAVAVASHAQASAALLAAEQYFGRNEPSSPALILVHQARMLVGKPLVVAIEALMPDTADYAAIIIDPLYRFEFSMSKMKEITDDYSATAEESQSESGEPETYSAQSRQEAAGLILGVSAFFRQSEPSSPIPMLLTKAEKSLNQSFQSIVADLLTKKTSE